MKNVQIIDRADNCTYSIFQFTDDQFAMIFNSAGQDIVFAEEMEDYLSDQQIVLAFAGVWNRPVQKSEIMGLHGTIFYGFEDRKIYFPASRRECDWADGAINAAERKMNAIIRSRSTP